MAEETCDVRADAIIPDSSNPNTPRRAQVFYSCGRDGCPMGYGIDKPLRPTDHISIPPDLANDPLAMITHVDARVSKQAGKRQRRCIQMQRAARN